MKFVQSRRRTVVPRWPRFLPFFFHCLAGLCGLAAVLPAGAASPDLIIWPDVLNPRIVNRNYATSSCDVIEGCALPGPRRYLIFDTQSRNIGNADLYLGSPASNTNFVFQTCHGHYHFRDFADYRLVNSAGQAAAIGNKVGFCLLDSLRWSSSASTIARYDCNNQGIQAGWADVYTANLSCQWVDITAVPPGNYLLEVEVNPVGRLPESPRTNNLARMSVIIDGPCAGPPTNDHFTNAFVLSNRVATAFSSTGCATSDAGEPAHPGTRSTNSVWFRWTAPYSGNVVMTTEGSSLDTVMAAYRGTNVASLTSVSGGRNDDDGEKQTSRISFTAASNTVYHIAVAGYTNAQGGVALSINPGGNDRFTNCLALVGDSGTVRGRNTTASRESGEPLHGGVFGTNSVWHCWRAPTDGLVGFDTEGSNFDTLLAVYTGARLTNLTAVVSDNDSGTNWTSRLYFEAMAGTNYWIAVDGVNGQSGFYALNWGPPGPGPQFESIERLAGDDHRLQLTGRAGQRYRIETSADFGAWSNWLRLTNLTGTLHFIDPASNNAARRYYRAVLVP